jgi:hypothetical protein
VLRTAKASEVVDAFKEKCKIELSQSGILRMYEVLNYRIHKFFAEDDLISAVNEFSGSSLYIEVGYMSGCSRPPITDYVIFNCRRPRRKKCNLLKVINMFMSATSTRNLQEGMGFHSSLS